MTAGDREERRLREEVEALSREVARQKSLVEASHSLHSTLDQDELLGIILRTASEAVRCERGTVYLVSADGREIWSRVMGGDESFVIRLPLGKGIAGSVAATGETIRIDDAYADVRFDPTTDRKTGFRTRSILCAPIKSRRGAVVGVFQLLNKIGGTFDRADEDTLEALSVHAALAIENAVLHATSLEKERQDREIRVAQGIQRALQPERSDREEGVLSIAGMNELCEDASGDYYDVVPVSEGRVLVALGDVSGHGLGAAMVMAEARAVFRALAAFEPDVGRLLDRLNDFLCPDLTAGRFMTFFAAAIDPRTGETTWASAGHNPAFLFRAATEKVEELSATGRVLGVLPDAGYAPGTPFRLGPRDALLVYTDGATEAPAPGGELFEAERLLQVFRGAAKGPPAGVLEAVRAALRAWTGGAPNRDDLTLLALRARG
jgi:sigma-B regulation protein RsbU (phosphoserine phosphatase)